MNKDNTPARSGLPVSAIGMPWFRREDFAIIKTLMVDAEKLHQTWDAWHLAAQQNEQRLKAQGHVVIRAVLIPDEFATWCKARGLRLDAKGRMEFAAFIAHQQNH
jgi:hypothetical protein